MMNKLLAQEIEKEEMRKKLLEIKRENELLEHETKNAVLKGRAPAFGGDPEGVTATRAATTPTATGGLADATGVGKSGILPGSGGDKKRLKYRH